MAKKHHNSGVFSTQFFTSLISTSLVLVLLGAVVFFVLTARNFSEYVKENINIEVLLEDSISGNRTNALYRMLKKEQYVKHVAYVSKEKAAAETIKEMGTDPAEFLGYNPFYASFEVKVKAEYAVGNRLRDISQKLKHETGVEDVIYQKDLLNAVNHNIAKISMILLVIAALFTYISFALINNTVRLTIFSKRFTINTMKLVGASWGFIRKPFLQRSLVLGLVAAAVADGVIVGGVEWMKVYEPGLAMVVNWQTMAIVGVAVVIFGLLITVLCTYFSLWKYLRLTTNELYHI